MTRPLTHEVYQEAALALADAALGQVNLHLAREEPDAAKAAVEAYQTQRDALWAARLAYAAQVVNP